MVECSMSVRIMIALAVAAGAFAAPAWAETSSRQTNWQGVYLGGHLGGSVGAAASTNTNGFLAGAHLGVNGQFDKVVLGVEADAGITTNGHTGLAGKFREGTNGSMRGRVGYAFDRVMVFGTGGIAVTNQSYKNAAGSVSRTRGGTVLGAGAELMLTENVAVRGEFMRYNYSKSSFGKIGGPENVRPINNSFRGGLSYKF
jgi:outer membrane immunogenic protein